MLPAWSAYAPAADQQQPYSASCPPSYSIFRTNVTPFDGNLGFGYFCMPTHHVTPCHATPYHAMPRHATPCHAMPRHASPHAHQLGPLWVATQRCEQQQCACCAQSVWPLSGTLLSTSVIWRALAILYARIRAAAPTSSSLRMSQALQHASQCIAARSCVGKRRASHDLPFNVLWVPEQHLAQYMSRTSLLG
jgi:hypothetical protein